MIHRMLKLIQIDLFLKYHLFNALAGGEWADFWSEIKAN